MTLEMVSLYDETLKKWSVELKGEVDVFTAKELKEELIRIYNDKKSDIELNFNNLNYIDSTGLGVIIGAYGRMKENNNALSITHPKQNITKLLAITGLDKILIK